MRRNDCRSRPWRGRPGNATGIALMSIELDGKRLEPLRQIRPALRRAAIIASPDHAGERFEREPSHPSHEEACGLIGNAA